MGKLYDVEEVEQSFAVYEKWVNTQAPVLEKLKTAFSEFEKSSSQFNAGESVFALNNLIRNVINPVYSATINLMYDYKNINATTATDWYKNVTIDKFFFKEDSIIQKRDELSTMVSNVINSVSADNLSLEKTIDLKNHATTLSTNFSSFTQEKTSRYLYLKERSGNVVKLSNSLMDSLAGIVVDGKFDASKNVMGMCTGFIDEHLDLMIDIILLGNSGLTKIELVELEYTGIPQEILYKMISSMNGIDDREGLRFLLNGDYDSYFRKDPANYSEGLFMLSSYYMSVNNVDIDSIINSNNENLKVQMSEDYEKFINEMLKSGSSQSFLYNFTKASEVIANENSDGLIDEYKLDPTNKMAYIRESNYFVSQNMLYSQLYNMDFALKNKMLVRSRTEDTYSANSTIVVPKHLVIENLSFYLDDIKIEMDRTYIGQYQTIERNIDSYGNYTEKITDGDHTSIKIRLDDSHSVDKHQFNISMQSGTEYIQYNFLDEYKKAANDLKDWEQYGGWYTASNLVGSLFASKIPILGTIYNELVTEGIVGNALEGPAYMGASKENRDYLALADSISSQIKSLDIEELKYYGSQTYMKMSDSDKSVVKEQFGAAKAGLMALLSYYNTKTEKEQKLKESGDEMLATIWSSGYAISLTDGNYFEKYLSATHAISPAFEIKLKADIIHTTGLFGWYSNSGVLDEEEYRKVWNMVLYGYKDKDGILKRIDLPDGVSHDDFRQLIFGYKDSYTGGKSLLSDPDMYAVVLSATLQFQKIIKEEFGVDRPLESITNKSQQEGE